MNEINENLSFLEDETISLTKKGQIRKRKPKQDRRYFTEDTEAAILEYVAETDQDVRNRIYDKRIAYSFYKLVENIIHTFKFYHTDSDTVEELKFIVIAFLLEKLKLFNPNKGKAYSYFGTITKRWLIQYNKNNYEKFKETCEVEEVDEDYDVTQDIIKEDNKGDLSEFIDLYVKYIDKHLYKIFKKPGDYKTADAIIDIFRKRESFEIFNKKAIYIYIRETSDVPTPQITKVIKKMKDTYFVCFQEFYESGDVDINQDIFSKREQWAKID